MWKMRDRLSNFMAYIYLSSESFTGWLETLCDSVDSWFLPFRTDFRQFLIDMSCFGGDIWCCSAVTLTAKDLQWNPIFFFFFFFILPLRFVFLNGCLGFNQCGNGLVIADYRWSHTTRRQCAHSRAWGGFSRWWLDLRNHRWPLWCSIPIIITFAGLYIGLDCCRRFFRRCCRWPLRLIFERH